MQENQENVLLVDLSLKTDQRKFFKQKENDKIRNLGASERKKEQQREHSYGHKIDSSLPREFYK